VAVNLIAGIFFANTLSLHRQDDLRQGHIVGFHFKALAIRRATMSTGTILLIILILLVIGVIPAWPYSRGWGYGPSGGLGMILIILLVLVLMGII